MTAKRLIFTLTLSLSILLATLFWLTASTSGLQAALWLASAASGERLQTSGVKGRLLGPLTIETLTWKSADMQLAAGGIELRWTPSALL